MSEKNSQVKQCQKGVKDKQILHSHPFISIGNKERALLMYISNKGNKIMNVKAYARNALGSVRKRTSVHYYLNKLLDLKLIHKHHDYDYGISRLGIEYLSELTRVSKGVKNSRRECQESDIKEGRNLSVHYHKFTFIIEDRSNFHKDRREELGPIDVSENHIHNLDQYMMDFEDAKIIINPKKVIISLKDILVGDVSEADFKAINKAIEYVKRLTKIGIICSNIMLESGHWARVESLLADFLEKIDERYFLDLGEGRKLWIDFSNGKKEIETNDKAVQERVDDFMSKVLNGEIDLDDINKITKAVGMLTKLKIKESISEKGEPPELTDIRVPDYFG